MTVVRLQAADGRLFAVDPAAARMSTLVQNLIDDVGPGSAPIPLPGVPGPTLARVLEYCTHHRDDVRLQKDVEDLQRDDGLVEPWDRRFMDVDDDAMLRLLCAADYLGVEPLVDLCCLSIARIIRHLPVDAIRQRYGIVDDFTDAERSLIAAEAQHLA
ncbi:hypothetical protein H4R18_001929 [Coemansia javaensis]|uniref:E3 ubiquitin ligase complex SCF subunit n=1 Tax=Coemansia javaensis TaxID=2761396 RepID=A0A9W8HJ37_9FUNG|nr:hypothetical protein H4R18_001929 [Coemansia javaensis]